MIQDWEKETWRYMVKLESPSVLIQGDESWKYASKYQVMKRKIMFLILFFYEGRVNK